MDYRGFGRDSILRKFGFVARGLFCGCLAYKLHHAVVSAEVERFSLLVQSLAEIYEDLVKELPGRW